MGKNVQNNYIILTSTIPQHYSPRHTLRTSVAASQQLLQAPRSPDPPAKAMLANTHTMSLERRKQHRHDAPLSRIDPSLSRDGCPRAPAVKSHLPRTTAPTQVQICPETQGEKHEEKMVSSDTRRSAAVKPRFYGVPRAI